MWPSYRVADLFRIEHPILLAPMAGAMDYELAVAVADGGGLGSLPCAMLQPAALYEQAAQFRLKTSRSLNLNFFCHTPPVPSNTREVAWRERLKPYYDEWAIDPAKPIPSSSRAPFDDVFCRAVEQIKPAVVSFHFGLPEQDLLDRVRAVGSLVISSATTVREALWLEEKGVDAVIAQGAEAGGHRGMFLTDDLSSQPGTFALLPQMVDAVKVPVIAGGGITDARGIAAAFALGASGVQIGSAYLHCPESKISPVHRELLQSAGDEGTVVTNVMSGRPARGIRNRAIQELGPISPLAPEFPLAAGALAPLRAAAEAAGAGDFSPMWAGQAASLGRAMPAKLLTRTLAAEAQELMRKLGGPR